MSDREIMDAKGFIVDEDEFRDPVVKRVVDKFKTRSDEGFRKYGTTLHEERTTKMKGLMKYLVDIQEELMDAILYIQTACVITEGEMDVLALHEAGVKNVISVPNGATLNSNNLDYLDNCIDYFEDKEKGYVLQR